MPLIDIYGRPLKASDALTKRLAEPGVTGIRPIFFGTAASGLTPVKLASILRSCDQGEMSEFLTLAEEMEERDAHYLSVLGTRKRVISGITPVVDSAGEDALAKEIANAVRTEIAEHDGLPGLVEDLLDALGKSFSVVEIEWARDKDRWRPGSFHRIDQRHFVFERIKGEELRLLTDDEPVAGVVMEPAKFITHRATIKSGLTYRGGLARIVAFAWMCKQYTMKDWIAFIETYGLPIRLGRYDGQATDEDVRKLYQAVANIGTDAAAVLPKSMEITFEQASTAASGERIFESFARWADEQISKAVLGQTMTSDSGSSEAQAKVHNDVRHDIAISDARSITATLNRDLIRPFVDFNFGVQEVYPRLVFRIEEPEDSAAKISGAVALAGIGVRFKAAELRQTLGFTDPETGDEIVGGAPLPPEKDKAKPAAVEPGALATNRSQGNTDAIDDLLGGFDGDWTEVADELEQAVAKALDGATSYEDALGRLPEALRHMPTGLAVETLVKGGFMARVLGDQRDQ